MKNESKLRQKQVYYHKNINEDKAKHLFEVAFRDDVEQIVTPDGKVWHKDLIKKGE